METRFERSNLTVQVWTGTSHYEVDLEKCVDSAELLDFILQMNMKNWSNSNAVAEFLNCLEEACCSVFNNNAQGVYCPGGQDMVVDWANATTSRKPWA